MPMTRLGLMLLGLTIVWLMCSRAELEFQKRFEDDVIVRMGGHPIAQTKLNIALEIKANQSKETYQSAVSQM